MVLAIVFVSVLAAVAVRIVTTKSTRESYVMPGALAIVLFASVSDLYFAQALTASQVWLLIGLGWGAHIRGGTLTAGLTVPATPIVKSPEMVARKPSPGQRGG